MLGENSPDLDDDLGMTLTEVAGRDAKHSFKAGPGQRGRRFSFSTPALGIGTRLPRPSR
jgi:hypothetical protein